MNEFLVIIIIEAILKYLYFKFKFGVDRLPANMLDSVNKNYFVDFSFNFFFLIGKHDESLCS